jgi:glycosyltransferase involved in cell wall biosynthesis
MNKSKGDPEVKRASSEHPGTSAEQMHILGLPSWYPDGANDHNGLFCIAQLQALAAKGHKVGIVVALPQTSASSHISMEVQQHSWGTACVARYRSGSGQMLQAIRYTWAMHKAWQQYQQLMGRPQYAIVLVAWKAGLFARWLKFRHGLNYNIIEHWGLYLSDKYIDIPLYLKYLFKYIYSGARSVAAVSVPLAQALSDHNLTKNQSVVVPNVVDTDCFRPVPIKALQNMSETETEKQLNVDTSPPFLMHVSNLAEVKNFGFILEVFAVYRIRYPHARLWVAGAFNPDDARKLYVHNSVNVDWFGFADPETLCRKYRQSVALLVASKHETFSIVTAEAIACGCPVLSCPLPALDAYRDWGTVHRLSANDPEAWAEVLSGWTQSRPLTEKGSWEGIDNAYGQKSVGECISKWITGN